MKKSLLLMLFLALTWCWTGVNAQEQLTVYEEGTSQSSNVPFYGMYADTQGAASECIIPSDLLEDMVGGTISSIKFYISTSAGAAWTGTHQVYIGEVTETTLTGISGPSAYTIVKTGSFDATGTELTIAFDAPYQYGGGNLLIGTYVSVAGNWKSANFVGVAQADNTSWYRGGATSAGSGVKFLPKTTFTYEPASTGCDMPTSITVSAITDNSATISWKSEGSAFNLRYKASDDADFTLIENITSSSYNLSNLAGNKNYSVGVQNVCSSATSNFKSTSFETANPCAAPKNLVVSNITASSATLSWIAGYQEAAWTVKYKKSSATEWTESPVTVPTIDLSSLEGLTQYNVQIINCSEDANSKLEGSFFTGASFPFNEAFNASSIPTGWAQYTGLLSDVMSGTALTSTTYAWAFGSYNSVFDSHARVNIYGNYQKWLVTPAIPMQAGAQLTFDLALTKYSGTLQAVEPGEQADDKFVVLASTDNGATWTILRQWDNAGSQDVYDDIACSATGQSIKINLEGYSSGNLMIAFYGESTVSGGDNNLHIDNVSIDLIPDCAKPTGLSASEITKHSAKLSWTENGEAGSWKVAYKVDDESVTEFTEVDATINPYPLTGLLADTTYIVKVRANCGGGSLSDYSTEISVSTPIACIAPLLTNTGITNITAHSADVAWAGDPDAVGFTVSYRTAAYMDGIDEGFENSTLPSGWTKEGPGTWAIGTGNNGYSGLSAHSGSYNAKAGHQTKGNETYLVTPSIDLSGKNGAHINLWYTNEAWGSDIDGFGVYYRVNGGEWNEIFATTAAHSSWTNIDEELPAGALVANCQFGFKFTDNYGYGVTLDDVKIGESIPAGDWVDEIVTASPKTITGLAAETKYEVKVKGDCGEDGESLESAIRSFTTGIACPTPTALLVSEIAPHQAKLSWTENGEATAWEVAYKLAGDADFGTPIAVTDTPCVLENLAEESAYVVKVRANCGSEDGLSEWSEEASFTTLADCPVPTSVATDNIKGHSATISWTGNALNEGYVLSYRTAAYMAGVNEEFGTSLPSGWENKTGLLSNVMDGSATLASGSQWVFGSNNGVFDNHARINIYGTTRYGWLITPEFTVPANAPFTFDLALTAYSGTGAASGTCEDDRFIVLIFADDEWQILEEWSNSTEAKHVFNDIPTAGENVSINLKSYEGKRVKVAFYGESTVSNNGDNNLHIDNVVIGVPVAAGAWTEVNNISAAEYSLSNLAAETKYDVVVQGLCAGNVVSDSSEIASFTTIESCVAPSALKLDAVTVNTATLSWTVNGDEIAWQYAYVEAGAAVPTEFEDASNPTVELTGLTANKSYDFYVRAYCGVDDHSEAIKLNFRTECDVVSLPFSCGFENTDDLDCWTLVDCHDNTGRYEGYAYEGSYSFKFRYNTNPPQYLISPELEASTNSVKVDFYYKKTSDSYEETFQVGYSTTNKSADSFIWDDEVEATMTYQRYSAVYPAGVKFVAIKYTANDMLALYIDNFKIHEFIPYELSINASRYATYYNADDAYIMPQGLIGHIFNASDKLVQAYAEDDVVPAGVPLVLEGDQGNYQLIPTMANGIAPTGTNDLIGNNEAGIIGSATDGYVYYVLSLAAVNPGDEPNYNSVGFYYMLDEGKGGFSMPAHKAYLKYGASSAPAAFFLFNGENGATWLENLQGVEGTVKFMHEGNIYILREGVIYDATGRQVRKL